MAGKRGYRTIKITIRGSSVPVYGSARTADALAEVERDMGLYHGVRLHQVLEAVYNQGHKDGAREAFEELDKSLGVAKRLIPHRPPGRPRTRRAA
jgi:hypothetical protein